MYVQEEAQPGLSAVVEPSVISGKRPVPPLELTEVNQNLEDLEVCTYGTRL